MSGLYQEKQFKKWYLKSNNRAILHKTVGLGLPDYYCTNSANQGIFIEVKYRYKGRALPKISMLTKEQYTFFLNFRSVTYLGYRTRWQGWRLYTLSKKGKFIYAHIKTTSLSL